MKRSKMKECLLVVLCAFLLSGCGEAVSSVTASFPSDTASHSGESSKAEEPSSNMNSESDSSDTTTQSQSLPESESEMSIDVNLEPPLSERDQQVPAPDFLPEDLQLLYRRAYKMMIIRIGTYAIDATDFFPCDTPDTSLTYWDQLTIDGKSYAPALNYYQSWTCFTVRWTVSSQKSFWRPAICPRTAPSISARWRGGFIICPPSVVSLRHTIKRQPKWILSF